VEAPTNAVLIRYTEAVSCLSHWSPAKRGLQSLRMEQKTVRQVELDDVVRLRKQHPCGGDTWTIVRLGVDIGLRCTTCGRRVLLERPIFERRVRQIMPKEPDGA
jgi:hypothetical protein